MSDSTVPKNFDKLPPYAKKETQDFVDFLYQRYVRSKEKRTSKPSSILNSSFFGIWKDREEMKDSTEWVRKVRKSQWPNR